MTDFNEVVLNDSNESDKNYSKEFKEAQKRNNEIYRALKRKLKVRSKTQLINLVVIYGSNLQEQRELNKFLYEENKELKAKLKEQQK